MGAALSVLLVPSVATESLYAPVEVQAEVSVTVNVPINGVGGVQDFHNAQLPTSGCAPRLWTLETARENCPPGSQGRVFTDKSYGARCCNCHGDEADFHDALANAMYNSCSDPCVYSRADEGTTVYEWQSTPVQCYERINSNVEASFCAVEHNDWKMAALAHASQLCDAPTSSAHPVHPSRPNPPQVVTEPAEEPAATEPVATKPAEEPVATKPAEDPVATKPAEEPAATEPAEEPAATEPAEEPYVPAYVSPNEYENLGAGECMTIYQERPKAKLMIGGTKECMKLCDDRFNCAGFTASTYDNCILWLEPTIAQAFHEQPGDGWEACMRKVVTEEQKKEHWNMCSCEQPGSVDNTGITCTSGKPLDLPGQPIRSKCVDENVCNTSRPVVFGDLRSLCKPVTEDEKTCIRLENVLDELCDWYNPPQNMGTELECQEQCLDDQDCIGYQLQLHTLERGNCDLIKAPCGGRKIEELDSKLLEPGSWSYVSRGCFNGNDAAQAPEQDESSPQDAEQDESSPLEEDESSPLEEDESNPLEEDESSPLEEDESSTEVPEAESEF